MAKILVGRDKSKEVEVGNSLSSAKPEKKTDVEEKKELAEAPVEDEQVVAVEEGDDAPVEEKETSAKRRGKKRGKA